ncbi:hypothetical protein NQZ68_004491 [Dissostichus eleginoides]|nr:hypothetical protein NQZ68_004491 [Dissostichus eleginoides]
MTCRGTSALEHGSPEKTEGSGAGSLVRTIVSCPALYAYNNAAFTDEDWEGIQMAGRSVKRNDPNKVGRFGIGFNSVYHITDVPSIFSSDHLGMMDPQEKIFGQRNSGFLWSLDDAEHQKALIEMHDQFQPFRDIVSLVGRKEWSTVINEDQHFNGTIFRREIKWQEEDQQHDEHAVWNELLMKEVLPQAYIMIIQDAINLAQQDNLPVSSVYDLWPDIAQIKHKRKWYAVARDVLDLLFRQNVAVLSLAKDEREFITPSEAVFPCNGPTSSDILAAIKRTLVSCGENLVTLPGSVASAIVEAYPHLDTLKHVTPAFIRGSLRRIDVHTISNPDKLYLLEFILSDEKYRELEGLQLLPLNDGSFRSFTDREEDTALIDSNEFPRVLLPFCKHLFIPDNLRPACSAHLKELARETVRENDWLKHDDLDSYVLCPSPWSVMKVLVNLDSQNLIRDLKTASHGSREELKDYLSLTELAANLVSNAYPHLKK